MGVYTHWIDLISIFIDQEGFNFKTLKQWFPCNLLMTVAIVEVWVGSHSITYSPWNASIQFEGFKQIIYGDKILISVIEAE